MIDYELLLDCVHCGLCTSACPTYLELGDENDGPRGRIYLMRAVTDGRISLDQKVRGHLDLCLDCRACESACPSGVQYGKLIEPFRIQVAKTSGSTLSWWKRLILFGVTPYPRRMRLALAPARLFQRLGLDQTLERLLPAGLRQMLLMLPRMERQIGRLPEILPAEGQRRARVALFTGCAGEAFFPRTNLATAQVLQKNGCEVWIPRSQMCCGALHYHAAREEHARNFASCNCEVFGAGLDGIDAIIVNAAGCGAMLKDYGQLLRSAGAERVAAKVRDIHEFLVQLGPVPPKHPLPIKAVYHDACHLCHGQQIRQPPRQLLEMIPELQLLSLPESEICCGAAGSYTLTQPEMAQRLGLRKARHIADSGAQAVFTGNVGCILQIGRYLREVRSGIGVAHPVDALWASYSEQSLRLIR
jgi:glycolate oxidase iron-sulfur subunit